MDVSKAELERELAKIGSVLICPVAVIVRDGRVLMGLRHYTADKWKEVSVWTIPGGRCDPGELVGVALRREVREEIGVTELEIVSYGGTVAGAKPGDMVPIFVCQTGQEPQLLEPGKFSDWRWFDEQELPDSFINAAALERIRAVL